jgi:hypothetical protein
MYQLTSNPNIVIDLDTYAYISAGSQQWDDYQTWLTAGNTPDQAFTLAQHQTWKTQQMSAACASEIVLGFNSNALGTWNHYPAAPLDQQNLAASVLDSVLAVQLSETDWTTPFWCYNDTNGWQYVSHTAAQIQQAGRDGKAQILACLLQNATLAADIAAMTEYNDVTDVIWTSPVGPNQPSASGYNLPTS